MHNTDPYGFRGDVSLEAFDNVALDIMMTDAQQPITALVESANALRMLGNTIAQEQGVGYEDALTMESIAPGILPYTAPVASFTKSPSRTNLRLALEAITAWNTMSMGNLVKQVYQFLLRCLKWVGDMFKRILPQKEDGVRVLGNINATVIACEAITLQAGPVVDDKTNQSWQVALDKAQLKVSDGFDHLLKRLLTQTGAGEAIRTLRNQLHMSYAKLDTVCNKYEHAIVLSTQGPVHYQEADGLLADIAGFQPNTLMNVAPLVQWLEQGQRLGKMEGADVVAHLRKHCDELRNKRASWDTHTSDTLVAFRDLTDRLSALYDALEDDGLSTTIPEVKDLSGKIGRAPEAIATNLSLASQRLTGGFQVAQDAIGIYAAITNSVVSITAIAWAASKQLMADVATKGKRDKDAKDIIGKIEQDLKTQLKRA